MQMKRWETVRNKLSRILNISTDVLDFLADYDIMLLSVSGSSNNDISLQLNIREREVDKTILNNIGIYCDGWEGFSESTHINPYFIFKSLVKSLGRIPSDYEFSNEMQILTSDASLGGYDFSTIYRVVSFFSTLRYKYLSKYRKEDDGNYLSRNTKKIT